MESNRYLKIKMFETLFLGTILFLIIQTSKQLLSSSSHNNLCFLQGHVIILSKQHKSEIMK